MDSRATGQRNIVNQRRGKVTEQTMEIQHLMSRALRAIINLNIIAKQTVWIDCDVIQRSGGTRTAAITGAFYSDDYGTS